MTKQKMGPYGQRNYSQMGDGHSQGKDNIIKEGSNAKKVDEKFVQYLKRNNKPGTPQPPKSVPPAPQKSASDLQKQIKSANKVIKSPSVSKQPIKQIKTKTVTKGR